MNKVIFHVERKTQDNTFKEQPKEDKINSDQLLKGAKLKQDHLRKNQHEKCKQENFKENLDEKSKTIREIEQFFEERYLGSRKNNKIADLNRLAKTPLFNSQVSSAIYQMRTPNLSVKLKQIEKIFSAQKKTQLLSKKRIIRESSHLTDLELYLTKRDVLRQKNQSLDFMKKLWQEEKKKAEEKRARRKTKILKKQEQLQQKITKEQSKDLTQGKQERQEKKITNEGQQLIKFQSQQLSHQQKAKNLVQIPSTNLHSTKTKSSSLMEMSNDEYFQKKFEQQIVKNSFSKKQKISIRIMLQTSKNRKTTINNQQYFKNQLDMIENVAKSTIDHFHQKQKINRIIYSQVTQSQEDFKSGLISKRGTPIIYQNQFAQKKSINWVLKECQNFKKTFNVRKTKSLSSIKRNS